MGEDEADIGMEKKQVVEVHAYLHLHFSEAVNEIIAAERQGMEGC